MPDVQNLGVAAVVVLLILDRVFAYLKTQKTGVNGVGEKPIELWQAQMEAAALKAVAPVYPILAKQTDILSELRAIGQRQNERDLKADFTLDNLRDGVEKVRSNQHDLRDSINIAIGRKAAGS